MASSWHRPSAMRSGGQWVPQLALEVVAEVPLRPAWGSLAAPARGLAWDVAWDVASGVASGR